MIKCSVPIKMTVRECLAWENAQKSFNHVKYNWVKCGENTWFVEKLYGEDIMVYLCTLVL